MLKVHLVTRVQSLKTGTVRDKFIDIVHELDLSRSAEVSSSKVDKDFFSINKKDRDPKRRYKSLLEGKFGTAI